MKKILSNKKLILLFVCALVFRISLIPVARHGDINNNTTWGQALITRGPVNFYEGKEWIHSAPNQPPLYVSLFALTAFKQNTTYNLIHWANQHLSVFPSKIIWWFDTWGELYIAKMPGIFADLGIAGCIYFYFHKKKKTALILSTLWLFNPISWYNSAIWGGTDSIVNLMGILSVLFLFKKRLTPAALFFVISVLFKGSLLLFIPLWLLIAVKQGFTQKQWLKATLYSFVLFLIVIFPFHPQLDAPIWFFNLYTGVFLPGEIGSLTANAFNFWWIVDSGKTLDSTLFIGLSARVWGIIITLLGYAYVLWRSYKNRDESNLFTSFALISLISFLFMTRMHERYLYPFFPFATFALGSISWLWVPYVLLSITHLLNLYHLFWAPGMPQVEAWYLNPSFMVILSILNLVIFAYLLARSHAKIRPIA